MFLINNVCIVGYLTHDAEWRQFSEERGVLTFSLAINHTSRPGTSQERKLVGFLRCKMFFPQEPTWGERYVKGQAVAVSGKLIPENWEAKDGTQKKELVVLVDQCHLVNIPKSDDAPREKKPKVSSSSERDEIVKAVLAALGRGKEAAKAPAPVEEGEPDTTVEVGEIAF